MSDSPTKPMTGKRAELIVHQERPFNAGPPLAMLTETFLTPNDLFFVRNHGAVPQLDPARHVLQVGGLVGRPLLLTVDELRRSFPKVQRTATLQCAGNRRQELTAIAPLPGELPWDANAISTAVWGGATLAELLAAAQGDRAARHIAFIGADQVERQGRSFGFGGSLPLDWDELGQLLVAYEMNGEPLPPVHGGPLRIIAPEHIGARSVKWLAAIVLQMEPSDNYFQRQAYRMLTAEDRQAGRDWPDAPMLDGIELTAAICVPDGAQPVAPGPLTVRGYALAGSGARIALVELSADGGRSWQTATLTSHGAAGIWSLWETTVALEPGEHVLVVRASDDSGQHQRQHMLWNVKGYMNTAWHTIRVMVVQPKVSERAY